MHDSGSARYDRWLTPAEFHAKYAPSAAQLAAVQKQLAGMGLQVTAAGGQRLHVTGPASAVEGALGTTLHTGPGLEVRGGAGFSTSLRSK